MRYRSRPQEVEAIQWLGDENWPAVREFGAEVYTIGSKGLFLLAGRDGAQRYVPVPIGHWIVRPVGDLTHHWPVDPDHFAAKYEPVA